MKYRHYQQLEDQIRRKEASNRAFANAVPGAGPRGRSGSEKKMNLAEYEEYLSSLAINRNPAIRSPEQDTTVVRVKLPPKQESSRALLLQRLDREKPLSRAVLCDDSSSRGKAMPPTSLLRKLTSRPVYRPGAFASIKRLRAEGDEAVGSSHKRIKIEVYL